MTAPQLGSGLFSNQSPIHKHLAQGSHGITGELGEIWRAVQALFGPMAAIAVEEFDAPPAASATAVMAAQATVSGPQTFTAPTIVETAFALAPRNLVITGGGTTAQCPTSALVTGLDGNGRAQTETIALTAGSGTGVKGWSSVTSVAFTGGTGTAGTEEIGTGVVIGLKEYPKARTGATTAQPPISELEDGAAVGTAGTVDTVNHTYTPHDAPNGTHKYAVYYEYDPTQIPVLGKI
jgi:hypothetical protein